MLPSNVDVELQSNVFVHCTHTRDKGQKTSVSNLQRVLEVLLTVVVAFGENLVLTAHPSKTGGDWWYGTVVRDGKSGFFPKTYVEPIQIGTSLAPAIH